MDFTTENASSKSIPPELIARDQWVLWRTEERGGKPTKVPYQACGRRAKSNESSTWTSYATASSAYGNAAGKYSGLGFAFAADDPYCGIDLDGCRNPETGEISTWAQSIIAQFDSYAEVSPSQTGVKIFCRGKLPSSGGKRNVVNDGPQTSDKVPGIECYDHSRYFAVTGIALPGSPSECRDCQSAIDAVWAQYFAPATKAGSKPQKKASSKPTRAAIDAAMAGMSYDASRVESAIAAMRRMKMTDSGDGSRRLFAAACRAVEHDLSDADAIAAIHQYAKDRPFPRDWTDAEILNRVRDAEKKAKRGDAIIADGTRRRPTHRAAGEVVWRDVPEIRCGIDEMRMTNETIAALALRDGIYQRGGVLVEARESPEPPPCIVRPDGGLRAAAINKWRLRELIADSARFLGLKKTQEGEAWVEVNVPSTVVEETLSRGVWRGIPALEGIVTSPQFLVDGSVLASPGYDKRSGLYFANGERFSPVPDAPCIDDAIVGRDDLLEVIADFPMDDISRASWLAVVLTGSARYAIDGPTPLFAIDANIRGSGKSLAADCVGIIHSGRQLPRTSATGADDEMRKRITATLLAGEPLVLLDNISGVLGCPALDALLTSTTWTDRILGESAMTAVLPARAIWLATGNNLQFAADTARRTLRIRLESMEESPEERTGFRHPNLLAWVRGNRGRLASAAATILRAWHVAGRPDMKLPPWGSFDSWSNIVRNAIVWTGLTDPGAGRQEVQRESDREAGLLRQLLAAWEDADPAGFGLTVAEAIGKAAEGNQPLQAAFAELGTPGKPPSPRSIGMKLHHLRGRVAGGKYFQHHRNTQNTTVWKVEVAESAGSTGATGTKPNPLTRARAHAHAHARVEPERAGFSSGTSTSSGVPTDGCNHLDPATWLTEGDSMLCPGCGKWMGRAKQKAGAR